MQCPPMDPKQLKWEKFKAFHVEHTRNHSCQIYQFDTREVLVQTFKPEPNARIRYPKLGLLIVSTIDDRFPALVTPEGVPVSRAHLTENGNQCLLIDEDTGRVTSLRCRTTPADQRKAGIPERFITGPGTWGSPTWFPGSGRDAITANTINVSRPRQLSMEERAAKRAVVDSCTMWATMTFERWAQHKQENFVPLEVLVGVSQRAGERPYQGPASSLRPCHSGHNVSAEYVPGLAFTDLSVTQRAWVALNGKLPIRRVETRHPYLLLASTPEPKAQEPHDVDENA